MKRRTLMTLAGVFPFAACSRRQFFNLGWNEEVKLHDGRVIVVDFKFTYERLDRTSEYGQAILRDTVMTFDSGPPLGRISQVFKRMRPVALNLYQGVWYAVIEKRGAGDSPTISGQDWGQMTTGEGQRTAKLTSNGFVPIPIAEFPDQLVELNLMRDHDPLAELAQFNDHHIDLRSKASYIALHPTHPADIRLKKPN